MFRVSLATLMSLMGFPAFLSFCTSTGQVSFKLMLRSQSFTFAAVNTLQYRFKAQRCVWCSFDRDEMDRRHGQVHKFMHRQHLYVRQQCSFQILCLNWQSESQSREKADRPIELEVLGSHPLVLKKLKGGSSGKIVAHHHLGSPMADLDLLPRPEREGGRDGCSFLREGDESYL